MPALPIEIRRAKRSDIPFITSSWLKSNRHGYMVRSVPNNIYYYNHHKILEELLPRSVVLVACNAEDPDQILGWMCAEVVDTAMVIHYVYVKQSFRKFGIAKRIVNLMKTTEDPPAVMATHSNPEVRDLLKEKNIIYNPYIMLSTLPDGWDSEEEDTQQKAR